MSKFTESHKALLEKLGAEVEVKKKSSLNPKEESIIAGFEEIQKFVHEHGRKPQHGLENDIFERIYALRLERLNELEEAKKLLNNLDHQKLIDVTESKKLEKKSSSVNQLLSALGVEPEEKSLQELKFVRTSAERKTAEEIAKGQLCKDFDEFKPIFEKVQSELDSGIRTTVRFGRDVEINKGDFYILGGIKAYVADVGERFVHEYGREDSRLRVIYDNGKESNLYIRSFQKVLWADDAGRRITNPDLGPLFKDTLDEKDQESGFIYILRSNSQHPEIKKYREIFHKIGSTNNLSKRLANASSQPTYLLADVEVVDTFKLYNLKASKFENIIRKIFSHAKLDIELKDRFGKPFKPREWFLVPLPVIREAIEKIKDGTISNYLYNVKTGKLEADS
jgi:hypothetical protein